MGTTIQDNVDRYFLWLIKISINLGSCFDFLTVRAGIG